MSDYKEGYADGYKAAIDDMAAKMFRDKHTRAQALGTCMAFWRCRLCQWVTGRRTITRRDMADALTKGIRDVTLRVYS